MVDNYYYIIGVASIPEFDLKFTIKFKTYYFHHLLHICGRIF
jgi:hypothetical protein